MFNTAYRLRVLFTSLTSLVILISSCADFILVAQEAPKTKNPTTNVKPDDLLQPILGKGQQLPAAEQSKLVRGIYDQTKACKSREDFNELIQRCDTVKSKPISLKNQSYATSIKGWALNRRGQLRLELARQYKQLGSKKRFLSEHQEAMKDFDEALIYDSKRHRTWNSRGIAFMAIGDWKKAKQDFTEATNLKPDFAAGWFNRAEANFHANQMQAAANDYATVLRFDSEDAEAMTGLALCQLAMGKGKEAVKSFRKISKAYSDRPTPRVNCGDALVAVGNWGEAQSEYEAAIQLAQVDSEGTLSQKATVAQQRLAWLLATCPDPAIANPSKAIELTREIIEADGETTRRLETLAAAQAAAGDFKSASTSQTNAIRLVSFEENVDGQGAQSRLDLYKQEKAFQLKLATPAKDEATRPKQD